MPLLLLYDIKPEVDPHGARIRLVRILKKSDAVPLQRSTWLVCRITPELSKIIHEIRALGGTVLLSEWKPVQLTRLEKLDSNHVVGLVIHGPEIVDLGWAEKIFDFLKGTGAKIIAKIGGTMGRTAVIDAKLDDRINVENPARPSQVINEFARRNVDLIIFLNHGKSIETGISLGMEVLEKAELLQLLKTPFVQIERPRESDGAIIPWTENVEDLAWWFASELNLKKIQPPIVTKRVEIKKGKTYRTLLGVHPGEKILVDGFVIGESLANNVTLVAENGRITAATGGQLDRHGVEKIGKVDLANATVKTLRVLRRTFPREKALRKITHKRRKAFLIKRAEDVLDVIRHAKFVVSIGDDTTAIAGEILSRFEIPILGIVDGDADGLLTDIVEKASVKKIARLVPSRSTVIKVKPGSDDEAGWLIENKIFKGKDRKIVSRKMNIADLKTQILKLLDDRVLEVITV